MTESRLQESDSGRPLTRSELQAVAYYLERFKYLNGYSAATYAEVERLVERCKDVARAYQ